MDVPGDSNPELINDISAELHPMGLELFGWFNTDGNADPATPGNTLLIGNAGGALWPVFSASKEYRDGNPDPLDRWTRRVIGAIADKYQAKALYPFEKPYHPFQQWARRATGMRTSPLGMLISSKYGLWQAFRAALVFDRFPALERPDLASVGLVNAREHTCNTCVDRPCLSACPVAAFDGTSFRVDACRDHLATPAGQACMRDGCKARNACPVGKEHRYPDAHIRFHMAAFR